MITLVYTSIVLVVFLALLRLSRAAALAGFFLLFSLLTRTAALTYLDLAGPTYAIELQDMVGGGASMPLFATAVLALIVPLAFIFRPSRVNILLRRSRPRLAVTRGMVNFILALVLLFMIALYSDMLWRGTIPLFQGIDRLDYNRDMAGPIHPLILDYGFLLAALIGMMMVYPRLRGQEFDFRFLAIYVAVIIYYALSGNRFSSFYKFTSFFVIPVAAVPMLAQLGYLPPPPKRRRLMARMLVARTTMVIAVGLLALALTGLLTYNLTSVRNYDDAMEQFFQRTVVQPVQFWWTTWRSMDATITNVDLFWNSLFINPLDPTRNTSIQSLMIKNLGEARASELLDNGQQYAGGYPEVLFEMFTPVTALTVALAFGIATAWLLRMVVLSVARGYLLTGVLATYVFYGFSLFYIGGMLNFLLVWTFWVKCVALATTAYLQHARFLRLPLSNLTSHPRL